MQVAHINVFQQQNALIRTSLQGKIKGLMNNQTPSHIFLFRGIILAGIIVLLLLLWKQHADLARIKDNYNRLQEQNTGLLNNSLQPQPAIVSPSAPSTPSRMPANTTQDVVSGRPTAPSPHPEKPHLILTHVDVQQTSTGLVAVMHFKSSAPTSHDLGTTSNGATPLSLGAKGSKAASPEPGATNPIASSAGTDAVPRAMSPIGLVAMSVRIPHNVAATIQSLTPLNPAIFSDSESTVSENGRFAFFQGTAENPNEVEFALAVSGSVRAFIKGTSGINSMQLDIQPQRK